VVKKLIDYGVSEEDIIGVRYGFGGFCSRKAPPVTLTRAYVEGIHLSGGTVLGTSRGGLDVAGIVRKIDLWGVDMLFVVGGNGGHAGAEAIRRGLDASDVTCSVVCVPKSIDNDIMLVDKTFGFDTAVEGDGVGKGPDLLEEDGRRLAFPENRIELSNAHETVVQPACGRRDLPGQRQLPTRREVLERRVHSGAIPLGEWQE
jgi:hypothetical protein